MTDLRTCTACDEAKYTDDFYTDRRVADGYRRICKQCDKARVTNSRRDTTLHLLHALRAMPPAWWQVQPFALVSAYTAACRALHVNPEPEKP